METERGQRDAAGSDTINAADKSILVEDVPAETTSPANKAFVASTAAGDSSYRKRKHSPIVWQTNSRVGTTASATGALDDKRVHWLQQKLILSP